MADDINLMTRKQFEELPLRKWEGDIGEFDSLIMLPTKRKHDSGFATMDFVAVRDLIPICRLSGCSDVLILKNLSKDASLSIDCLFKSKLLRVFSGHHVKFTAGLSLSSFYVSITKQEKKP